MTLRPSTMRFRVTAVATVAVIAVLVATSIAVVTMQRRALTESVDEMMSDRVDELAAAIAAGETPVLTNLGDDDTVAQIVSPDGVVLAASPGVGVERSIGPVIASGQQIRSGRIPGVADEGVRVLSRRVRSPDGDLVIHLAASTDDVDDNVQALRTSMSVVVPIVAALLAALTWYVVGRTLRPVERIRVEVASIGGSDLDRRVPVPGDDDEIARLARTMNDMLARLEDASSRQRRFVADAAHELRSPLTRMRTVLEVDVTHPRTADPLATHRSVLEEIDGLQQLVDDLLLLARHTEADLHLGRNQIVDVAAVARRSAEQKSTDGPAVDVDAASPAVVAGNARELSRAIGNLVDNATRHARSEVRIDVASGNGDVTVAVSDDGPGVPVTERERIFERFARLDESRTAGLGGTGLGLSIARDIVERHGGNIAVDQSFEGGARFTVRLPAAAAAGGPDQLRRRRATTGGARDTPRGRRA